MLWKSKRTKEIEKLQYETERLQETVKYLIEFIQKGETIEKPSITKDKYADYRTSDGLLTRRKIKGDE